jgi:hypothetical protein
VGGKFGGKEGKRARARGDKQRPDLAGGCKERKIGRYEGEWVDGSMQMVMENKMGVVEKMQSKRRDWGQKHKWTNNYAYCTHLNNKYASKPMQGKYIDMKSKMKTVVMLPYCPRRWP